MKKIGGIAAAAQDRISVIRKAPQRRQVDTFEAARRTAPPLSVIPATLFDHLDILRDASALAVFFAICNHANKAGMTKCSQERLAALTRLSRKTIGRKVKKLTDAGLVRIEYRRPYQGSPKRLNIMRVIYDNGTMTRQDAHAIASPPMGQANVSQVNPDNGKLSTGTAQGTSENPNKTRSPMGQHAVPQVEPMAILGQVSDSPMGQIGYRTYGTDKSPTGQAKALNNRDIVECLNKALLMFHHKPIETSESDLQAINGTSLTEADITGAVADYLLDCQEARQPAQPSIHAILGDILQAH